MATSYWGPGSELTWLNSDFICKTHKTDDLYAVHWQFSISHRTHSDQQTHMYIKFSLLNSLRTLKNTLQLRCSTLTFTALIPISHCVSSCSPLKDSISDSVLSLAENKFKMSTQRTKTDWADHYIILQRKDGSLSKRLHHYHYRVSRHQFLNNQETLISNTIKNISSFIYAFRLRCSHCKSLCCSNWFIGFNQLLS